MGVTQLVEYYTFNVGVEGSNPSTRTSGLMAELVDAGDLKSLARKGVPVRVRPWPLTISGM